MFMSVIKHWVVHWYTVLWLSLTVADLEEVAVLEGV